MRGGGSVRRRNTLHVVGGREFILTSAVYGEREYFVKYKILQNEKKRENNIFIIKYKIFCERIKCEKTVIYP